VIQVARKLAPRGFNGEALKKGRAWLKKHGLPRSGLVPRGVELKPLWTRCLDALYDAYGGVCAYMCIFIEKIVGTPTVDHFIPKSLAIEHAYRWSNYRLASLTMNQRKRDHQDVLDPFTLPHDTFFLSLYDGRILPNKALASTDPVLYQKARDTIARLGLDDEDCCALRLGYFETYMREPTAERRADLERRAPA
jgi:hypothetical protein